jgi:hypothetical protein
MAEERKGRKNGRRGRNGPRNGAARTREATSDARRMTREQTALGSETAGVWADLNQRVMQNLTDLWLRGAREGARTFTEIQEANLEAWREAQDAAFRLQTMWPDALRDPMRWYQRALEETVDSFSRPLHTINRRADIITRTAGRMRGSTQETGRQMQQTMRRGVSKIQDITGRSTASLRAA